MKTRRFSISARCWAVILTLAMLLGMLPVISLAAESTGVSAAVDKVADPGTVNTYQDLLGTFADGNRYAGRLWTDKSVFYDEEALVDALGDELAQEQLAQLGISPEEFLVIYSALGSTTSVYTEQIVSGDLDVVIVLDISASMGGIVTDAAGNRVTRLEAVTEAANALIAGILENSSNRLALVTYSTDASVILELDRYAYTENCLTATIISNGQVESNGNARVEEGDATLGAQADSLTDSASALQGQTLDCYQRGTNLQSGINEAMTMLYNSNDTANRTPVVIVMTDGVADMAAYQDMLGDTSGDGNYKHPQSNTITSDVALSTLLNAAYWKYMLGEKYPNQPIVYTVGVDVSTYDDASVVLDPASFFRAEGTTGFSSVALAMLELYTEWSESNSAVTGSTDGSSSSGRPGSGSSSNRYTWTFPQPDNETIKTGIENNICYSNQYFEVGSADLALAFDDILTSISSLQDAFQAIEKTDITKGESSMVYVDFIGDYMELKNFNGVSLYDQFYAVSLNTTVSMVNGDGTTTVVYTYKISDNNQKITHPISGEEFLLSENVIIELKHTYRVDELGNQISAGEQDLWVHIDEQVLPLVYHKVETENDVTTYTVYEQKPVRFYYTVGLNEFVAPAGNLLPHRIDADYLAANTDENGVVYFYANQYFAQDDDETLVNHTKESGYGDAHNAVTPDASNRYYIHQYNYPIYSAIVDANGDPVVMDPDTYGVPQDSSYVTSILSYADLATLNEASRLYTEVSFHAPTGEQQATDTDGGRVYSGKAMAYYVFTQWGHLLNDVVFYDSINGVYINADGTTSATEGVWNENYTFEQYLATVEAYLAATDGITAEDLHAYLAIGSWRIPRFANRTFAKESNLTGTATLRIAPVLDSNDETDHEGSIVAWLGNNGRIGYNATMPKTVSDAAGNDIDGQLVVIGDVLTYTITATNYEDAPATIVITDQVPSGTAYVENSADNGGILVDGKLTWTLTNVAVGETVTVSYQVKVTGEDMTVIENTAYITIGNNPAYETNTTENPPVGKTSSSDGYTADGEVQVGDILTYTIYYHNDTDATAVVTVSDWIPSGTTYVEGSASYSGTETLALTTDSNGVVTELTWVISQVPAGQSGSVHFQVRINASAVTPIDNVAQITVGENGPIVVTNEVVDDLAYGDLSLTKVVATGNADGDQNKYFTLVLQSGIEGVSVLEGTFQVTGSSMHSTITFVDGATEVLIKHGETITIQDLPAGITVTVYEKEAAGYTAVYSSDAINIVADQTVAVDVTNIYNVTPTSVTFTGSKVLHGLNLEANTFSFLVLDENGDVVAGGVNDADGNIHFDTITYAAAGVYTYTIREVNAGATGITYDTTEYTVTVTVTDDGNGVLTAAVSYPEGGLVFTNTYIPEKVQVTLDANKVLTGTAADGITAGEYSFNVYTYDFATGTIGQLVSGGTTVAGETGAAIQFAPVGFELKDLTDAEGNITLSKDFYFLIQEDIPVANGPTFDPNMYYDATGYLAKVTVTYDPVQGILVVSAPQYMTVGGESISEVTFTNIQNPDSVEVTPVGNKTTTNAPDGITFSFSVINTANQVEAGVGVGQANGAITFTTLSFTEPGTYTYKIVESNAGNTTNGITYDDAVFYMTVVVTRDSTNKLVASVSYADAEGNAVTAPAFHNEYHAAGYINITATKQLDGRDLNAGEFAFKLVRQDNGSEIDGIVAADGTITFATMYYSLADFPAGADQVTIHYVMSEVIPEATKLSGVTYDNSEYDVYVTIVDNGDGTIRAFLSDENGNALNSATDTGITFTNTYTVTTGTDAAIQVDKVLTGRDLEEGEFTFMLYRYDGGQWKNVASTLNTADGVVSFLRHYNASALNHLAFNADGTYTVLYRIDEVNNHLGGVTYDTGSIYVKVIIFHDETTASYRVDSIGYYSDEACQNALENPAFVNTYKPEGTSLVPQANKVLTGRDLVAGEFSFVIKDHLGDVVSYGTMDAQGNISFTPINFQEAGAYTFTMYEVAGDLGGVTYDATGYIFTVNVTDNGEGELVAVAAYPNGGITFQNTYTPKAVSVQPTAVKILDGKVLENGEFTFVLADAQGNVISTATNDASGAVIFEMITYTQPGTYHYSLYERAGEDTRYTYSSTVYNVTVVVTDNGDGNLYASHHIYRDGTEVGAVTFYNNYTPDPIALDLNDEILFVKTVEDPAGTGISPEGFVFQVYNWNGDLVSSAISDAQGNIDFEPDLIFTEAGEYHYRVVEAATDENGVSYDTTIWVVTVTVAYDAETGILAIADVVYGVEGGTISSEGVVHFTNTYAPTSAQVTVQLNKTLTGRDLVEGEFLFQLLDGNVVVAEAYNDANGNVTFQLTYEQVGTYTYTVVEVAGDRGGVTYDDAVHTLVITVTDVRADGKLEATATFTEGNGSFVNEYKPSDSSITLTARKLLTGRVLQSGEFTFILTDAEGNTYEAVNAADGTVVFDTITYTEAGTYVYTIHEQAGSVGGVTYSNRIYTATVTVTDDLEGKLIATVVYTYEDSNGVTQTIAEPLFRNIYAATDSQLSIEARKTLSGRDLAAGEFTFILTDEEGNTIEAVNSADGTVIFDAITYTEAGIYVYTIHEQAGSLGGVTYSDLVYTATVIVTDDGNGNLVAEVSYSLNGEAVETATFVNIYQSATANLTLEATKTLSGRQLLDGEFVFVLTDADGNAIEAVNGADGTIRFLGLEYTEEGIYTYTLSEVLGEDATVIYDETVHTIVVTVVDNGNGQLEIASITVNGEAVDVTDVLVQTGILFVNVYDKLPETGDKGIRILMSAMTISLLSLVVLVFCGVKRRRKA